ncbi:MAG: hypothetical protein WA743_14435 [Pseudolabrys sp.]
MTGTSSGTCCTASSPSPRATSSAMRPAGPTMILSRIASVMPSRSNSASKDLPLAPSLDRTTDFAFSSARLKASTVPMSGLGAPFFTDTPSPQRARSALPSRRITPCAASSSTAARVMIATSNAAPPSISRLIAAVGL